MEDARKRLAESDEVQSGSIDGIAIFEELEGRRKLVERGRDRLLTEEESWTLLRKAGIPV